MLTIGFSAYDLAVMRFAFSPMQEIVASVRVLKDPAAHALHVPWVKQVAPRVAAAAGAFDLLFALVPVPSWYIPDFVTPPPTTPVPDLQTELADLRRTAPQQVRTDLDRLTTLRDPARR
ncbi:ArsR family transcriptional regulator, partial [Micromonospora sp. ALFpr18c]